MRIYYKMRINILRPQDCVSCAAGKQKNHETNLNLTRNKSTHYFSTLNSCLQREKHPISISNIARLMRINHLEQEPVAFMDTI